MDACLERDWNMIRGRQAWERRSKIEGRPAEGEFENLGIGGLAADAVAELVALASAAGDEAEEARGAIARLLRLSAEGAA